MTTLWVGREASPEKYRLAYVLKQNKIHVDFRVLKYVMQRITTHLSPARTRFSSYSCVRRYDKCLSKFLKTA